jgi:uncharacterized membrane protein
MLPFLIMDAYILDWLNLLFRWLHVIVGIAWIGSSFYFVWLDNSLEAPNADLKAKGVSGELWAVHGGGFYNPQKYMLAPKTLPEKLHWFYWESYSTWLSGFALFLVIYIANPNTYLIDKRVLDWSVPAAVSAAFGFLIAGWVLYDVVCRVFGKRDGGERTVGILITVMMVFAAWLACQLFAGRAAFLIVGAMMATIMSANVLMVIIPGQRKVVASMKAGQTPDPIHGKNGKQRSVHNTYFTLPVLFAMMSNHYAMTYSHQANWLVLVLMMLAGALIRQFFVLRHRGTIQWGYWIAAALIFAGVFAWLAPRQSTKADGAGATANRAAVNMNAVQSIIDQRCVACHNEQVQMKNIQLHTPTLIRQHAQSIYQQAVVEKLMPMNNSTGITDAERATLGQWFQAGAK